MKRQMILFWLILFSFLKAFSGAEYLPEKMSEAEKEEAIQVVRSRLPWAMYNNISYVDMQINGLKALRKRFPEFDKWAQEKPDPITITIDKETVDTRTVSVLNAEQLRALRQDLKQNMDSIQEQHKDLNAETLRTLVFKELGGL
ncbi:MAG: hypothetical protein ACXWC9_05155, partial [Pseudobdellovibrionaceae bacterium]